MSEAGYKGVDQFPLPGRVACRCLSLQPGQAVNKGYARRRRTCRRRWRRRRRRWRIRPFPNVTLITRPLGDVACAGSHPVPGMANAHIPLDSLVRPTPIHIHGVPRAPVIRAVPARTKGAIARLGGTCAQAQPGHRDATRRQRAGHDPLQGAIGIHVVMPLSPAQPRGAAFSGLCADRRAKCMGHLTYFVQADRRGTACRRS